MAEREGAPVQARRVEGLTARYDGLVAGGREAQPPPDVPQSARRQARSLLRRLARRKAEVLLFLSDPSVPFGNNLAERGLRMVKVRQEVSGCFRAGGGGAAVLPDQGLRPDRPQAWAGRARSARRGAPRGAVKRRKTHGIAE